MTQLGYRYDVDTFFSFSPNLNRECSHTVEKGEQKSVLRVTDTLDSVFVTLPTHTKNSKNPVFVRFAVDDPIHHDR